MCIKVLAFNSFRTIYFVNRFQDAVSFISKIFGPKAHVKFPRKYRLAGQGCVSDGFYPTTTDGKTPEQGVDLVITGPVCHEARLPHIYTFRYTSNS